jgi:hypothetical protein
MRDVNRYSENSIAVRFINGSLLARRTKPASCGDRVQNPLLAFLAATVYSSGFLPAPPGVGVLLIDNCIKNAII